MAVLLLLCALCASVAASTVVLAAEEGTEVVASRSGFRPEVLKVRKGDTIRLLLKTDDREHCFAVDAFRVEKRIVPGKTTTLDLTPDQGGTFAFYCCLEPGEESQRGRLVVSE